MLNDPRTGPCEPNAPSIAKAGGVLRARPYIYRLQGRAGQRGVNTEQLNRAAVACGPGHTPPLSALFSTPRQTSLEFCLLENFAPSRTGNFALRSQNYHHHDKQQQQQQQQQRQRRGVTRSRGLAGEKLGGRQPMYLAQLICCQTGPATDSKGSPALRFKEHTSTQQLLLVIRAQTSLT